MKLRIAFPFAACFILAAGSIYAQGEDEPANEINPTEDADSPTGFYIPEDIEDCFTELETMLHPDMIEEMRSGDEDDMIMYHHGLGRWIRNNWGLWSGSRLFDYLYELGLHHPDDMSDIILHSFWRYLNDRPLELEEQVQFYIDY